MFADPEIEYLNSQDVLRIGTVSDSGQVDVSPVGFHFDDGTFYIGSSMLDKTHKGKNVAAGNTLASIAVDDLPSTDPYLPRGIKIHGVADLVERDGTRYIRVRPTRSWSFGLLEPGFQAGKWTTTKLKWPTPS